MVDALLACAPAHAQQPALRVGVNMTTIESAPVFLAAEGRADIRLVPGGIPRLIDGSADAATHASTQAILRSIDDPGIRIVMTIVEYDYRIVARRSAGIGRLADLRGKMVATPLLTSAHFALAKQLQAARRREADVQVIGLPLADMAAMLRRGGIDAVAVWEPVAYDAAAGLGADAVELGVPALYSERFDLNTTTAVLRDPARRAALVGFVRDLLRAAERTRNRPAEVTPLIAAKIKVPEATIARVWDRFRFIASLPDDLLAVLVEEEAWAAAHQHRPPRAAAALAELIDASVLRDAARP